MDYTTELFQLYEEGSDHNYLVVEMVKYEMSPENDLFFSDILWVSYKGKVYRLDWEDYDACYVGEIDGKKGYIQ